MITVKYNPDGIRIETEDLSKSFEPYQLPLMVDIRNTINNVTIWSVKLGSHMWAAFPQTELKSVVISDAQNKFVYRYDWEVMKDGSPIHKALWLFCTNLTNQGKTPRGLAIGTHDGAFGEWVPVATDEISRIILVEGSKPQYDKLVNNFQSNKQLQFINDIVTTDGNDVTFFEGGKGYTNSVVERVIRNWETEEINSTTRSSISLNKLIKDYMSGEIDWLHLDVEGLDAKLIMSMDETYPLPKLIIFEHENLESAERSLVNAWLETRKYKLQSDKGITMASIVTPK
jgi:hypothetical protein